MTQENYIDHVEKIKLDWKEIKHIWIITFLSSFLKVTVIDNKIVYKQTANPIWKFMFWNNAWNSGILSINLTLLKGKNHDIIKHCICAIRAVEYPSSTCVIPAQR